MLKHLNGSVLFFVYWLFLGFQVSAIAGEQAGVKQRFNDGWLFSKGELPGAEKNGFEDKTWRPIDLPHDWAIEGPFDRKYNARNGGLPVFGHAWYRKHFTLPPIERGQRVYITLDGAMYDAHVYVNGQLVGNRPFGYIAFEYDVTPYVAKQGEENVIAVHLSPKNYATRWYSGAGIYRNTWLEINDQVHVKRWGTFVRTPKVNKKAATVALTTELVNAGSKVSVELLTQILNAEGAVVQEATKKIQLSSHKNKKVEQEFVLKKPRLWDIDDPYRYRVVSLVKRQGKVVDRYETPLGVRNIAFKPNDGFWLNGRRVQIQGVCLHHDNGPIGAVVNTRAIERKFEIMKSMGVNSIRTSHNPPSPEFVELADKMGLLLQVEAFDMWEIEKPTVVNGYHLYFDEWHERDLRDMIKQSRNHPSVIMWSTGNEVHEQRQADGWKLARRLTQIAHDEDPTRLVTNGFSMYPSFLENKLVDEVDIVGLNYKAYLYEHIRKLNPKWVMLGTETSSVVSTRGEYHFPIEKYRTHPSKYVSSYDVITPPWAYIPDVEFENLKNNPSVMGEYIWTGIDYLGEPTPYGGRDHGNKAYWNQDWPARSSSFGAVDLAGFPKDRFYLYQSQWTTAPMVHVLPHWNWENKIGESIPVFAYTNAEEVELFVNGKSQGRKVKGVDKVTLPIALKYDKTRKTFDSPYRLRWDVVYQPGELKVVAYKNKKAVAEKVIRTASAPHHLELVPDRQVIRADGQDLSFITVDVKDKDGNFCPTADNKIQFFVKGPGEIAAVGNGDSVSEEPFITNYRRAFNGKALLIVRSKKGKAGEIKISAYSDQLTVQPVSIRSEQ